MKLDVKTLTRGLEFHGEVEGKRQRYAVLSSPRQYFVMSLSRSKRDAGNFNLVGKAAVEKLHKRLRGKRGLTARLVYERSRRGVPSALAAAPGLRRLFDGGYRAFADHRHRISAACRLSPPAGHVAPGRRVFLTAEWRHLVMLNYEVDPDVLAPLVPAGTALDLWQGRALVSVVGFRFLDTRVLGTAIPRHRAFDEVNLRFYVRRDAPGGETRRGVVFVRELVSRVAVALVARLAYNEPYRALRMRSVTPPGATEPPGRLTYEWRIGGGWETLAATAVGTPAQPEPGSEAAFITRHHWGYTRQRDGGTVEYEVEHPPWR